MATPVQRSPLWLTAALATLLAVALGVGLGWWLRGGDVQAVPLPPAPASAMNLAGGATREEIESLKRELLARFDALARQPTTHAPANSDGQVIELGRRIEELDARIALLDKQAPRPEGAPLWTPPRGPGSSSIEAMIERAQAWYHPNHPDRSGDEVEEQLRKEHDLWKFEDVVRAYGEPRRWERSDGGWDLYYGSFAIEGWDEKQSIEFCLRDGFLQNIEIAEARP